MDDALSKLLQDVRPQGALFSRTVSRAPWSLRFVRGAAVTLVTMIGADAWLTREAGEPVRLAARDVALVTGPAPFVVADSPSTAPTLTVDGTWLDGRAPGPTPALLTATYEARGSVSDRVLGALPPVAIVPAGAPPMEIVQRELTGDRPGRQAVLDRALDVLLVDTLRAWFDRPESPAPAWYRAYADPVIGQGLRLVDENPAHAWTVADLASKVGLSRATFAKRFADLVGQPPMAYVTEWRLCLAADQLRRTDATVDTIARRVGYANVYALSVAFKRVYGTRPSDHRADR
jgi:AraC-like DNA-binding protein